jgi:GAF domain-containing protein
MEQELIDALTHRRIDMSDPNVAAVMAAGEPIQTADLKDEVTTDINEITLRAGYRARLVAPLIRGEEVIGMLVVRRKTRGAFAQNTIELMKTFAAQSAVAIENAHLFQHVESSLQDFADRSGPARAYSEAGLAWSIDRWYRPRNQESAQLRQQFFRRLC